MNHPAWCSRTCGLYEVCSDRTYENGYCLEPKLRAAGLATKTPPPKKEPYEAD
jgi:hypothetical protein